MRKLASLLIITLLLFCGSYVFAAENGDTTTTTVTYTVPESYVWSAPTDVTFTEAERIQTSTLTVSENIIPYQSFLVISIPDQTFVLTSTEGATRSYKVYLGEDELTAGNEVLRLPAGITEGSVDINFKVPQVENVEAGTYTGTLNFTAKVTGDYGITYYLDGGTNNPSNPSGYKMNEGDVTIFEPTKIGYTFAGWYDNAEFTGSPITKIVNGTSGNVNLYAKWEIKIYTINYNLDEGVLDNPKITYNINDSIYILPSPTKEGFEFIGWYEDSSFNGSAVTEIQAGSYGDKTYYAKWEPLVYYSINDTYDGNTIDLSGYMKGTNTLKDLVDAHSELSSSTLNFFPTTVYISNTGLYFKQYSYSLDSGSTWENVYLVSYMSFARFNGDIKCSYEGDDTYCFTDTEFAKIQEAKQNGTYEWEFDICTCLTGDTEVIVTDEEDKKRRKKKLKDIKVGDYILSFDWKTKNLVPNKVIFTDANENKFADKYDKWYFEDGTIIKTVHRHEFYNCEAKRFMYMDEWKIGDHAYKEDGAKVKLIKHETVYERVQHYKITGEKGTNYFANTLLNGDRYNPEYIDL